jgi:hypothetical protein
MLPSLIAFAMFLAVLSGGLALTSGYTDAATTFDDLVDFTKIFSSSGDGTLATWTASDPSAFPAGDMTGILKVDHAADRFIVYAVSGMTAVSAEYLYYSGDSDFAKNRVLVSTSSDGITYDPQTADSTVLGDNGTWKRMTVTASIPAGTTKVKITLDPAAQTWEPIMTGVTLSDEPLTTPTVAPTATTAPTATVAPTSTLAPTSTPAAVIEPLFDDLLELSKTYASSGAGTLTFTTLDAAQVPAGDLTGVLKADNAAPRFLVYELQGNNRAIIDYIYYSGDLDYSKDRILVFWSEDGVDYSPASVSHAQTAESENGWLRIKGTSGVAPAGTRFVKLVLDGTSANLWEPILTSVRLVLVDSQNPTTGDPASMALLVPVMLAAGGALMLLRRRK